MDFKELIDLAVSNGIGIICIIYFMVRDWRFMDTMTKTLESLDESTKLIEHYFLKSRKGDDNNDV